MSMTQKSKLLFSYGPKNHFPRLSKQIIKKNQASYLFYKLNRSLLYGMSTHLSSSVDSVKCSQNLSPAVNATQSAWPL